MWPTFRSKLHAFEEILDNTNFIIFPGGNQVYSKEFLLFVNISTIDFNVRDM